MRKILRAATWCSLTMLLMLSAPLAMASCASNNHVRPADVLSDEVHALFEEKDYKKLDALARKYKSEQTATFDGQSALMAFYQGIAENFNNCAKSAKEEEKWLAHQQDIENWITASPHSTAARLALALFTIDYAWHGRGSGYASTVDEKSWAAFKERTASAKAQLDKLAPLSTKDPAWHAGMLDVALAQGWRAQEFDAIYRKAVRLDPYYLAIHYASGNYYSKNWHGSDEQMHRAIEQSVKLTTRRLGATMYARMHWSFSDQDDAFKTGRVSWERMKAGFEDSLRIYPDDWTRSNYARFACMAGDSGTLKEQLAELGDRVKESAWHTKGGYTYCKALVKADGTGKLPQCYRRLDTNEVFCE